jgi:hypothetical protein
LFKRRSYRIKLELVQKIADFLGTTTDYLAKGSESTEENSSFVELERVYTILPVKQQHELMNFAYYLLDKIEDEKSGGFKK